MAVPISELLAKNSGNKEELYRKMLENFSTNLRVAAPGIIQSFDPIEQTVTVQVAIREKITNQDLTQQWVEIPLLLDVPIVIPRAGGYVLTFPISPGDECLVVFGDTCIDAWFSNGGIQNQMEKRRHDLSDAFAILGVWSQPRKIPNYSTSSAQMRSDDGSTYINLSNGEIDLVASSVKINGIDFSTHIHIAPAGGATSGPEEGNS
jgi:hypothetical protein